MPLLNIVIVWLHKAGSSAFILLNMHALLFFYCEYNVLASLHLWTVSQLYSTHM